MELFVNHKTCYRQTARRHSVAKSRNRITVRNVLAHDNYRLGCPAADNFCIRTRICCGCVEHDDIKVVPGNVHPLASFITAKQILWIRASWTSGHEVKVVQGGVHGMVVAGSFQKATETGRVLRIENGVLSWRTGFGVLPARMLPRDSRR